MPLTHLPQTPFGAVYFRKSNPLRADWARDYQVAAEDGPNVFRHWFMWSAIERKPGVYDWADYDRQMDLAAQNGIRTIVAELTHTVPDWAYRQWSHARQIRADGRPMTSNMGVSAATGGFSSNGGGAGALTMNCPEVRQAVGAFLTALATRYKGHPALPGYDVWNEVNYAADVDYSDWMKADFRLWLKAKYGDLETLAEAWYRYSYADWDDMEPPAEVAAYPENLDWLDFKRYTYYDQMQFKIDTIRAVDGDWLAASKVELYGLTWVPGRRGFAPWQNFFGPDLTRAAARGKKWWHAGRPGGPLWLQPQVLGRDKEDGRVMDAADIRVLTMTSFAAGATGVMNLRYRPLLDGPLFGAFGSYGMDGSRTDRSDMASRLAKWANDPATQAVFDARPVSGDIGLLVIPEAQAWDDLLNAHHLPDTYRQAMWGAYRGLFDNGLQPDWVHIDDLDTRDTIYAPYPINLTAAHAERLADWVARGGCADLRGDAGLLRRPRQGGHRAAEHRARHGVRRARGRGGVHARHRRPHPHHAGRRAGAGRGVPSILSPDDGAGTRAVHRRPHRGGREPARQGAQPAGGHQPRDRLLQDLVGREPALLCRRVRLDRPDAPGASGQPRPAGPSA